MRTKPVAMVGCVAMLVMASCNSGGGDADSTTTTTAEVSDTAGADSTTTTAVEETTTTVEATTTTVEATTTTVEATTTTVEATTTTVMPATDAELAQSALLTIDDFPEGWLEGPPPPDDEATDDNLEFDTMFADCLGIPIDDFRRFAYEENEADGPEFASPDATASVGQAVRLAPDEAEALMAMEMIGRDGIADCYQVAVSTFFTEDFASDPANEGITLGDITVVRLDTAELPPDEVVMLQTEIPFEFDGQPASQFLTVVYQRQGRALSQMQLSSFGQPFDVAGIGALGELVEQNLAAIG